MPMSHPVTQPCSLEPSFPPERVPGALRQSVLGLSGPWRLEIPFLPSRCFCSTAVGS